MGQTQKCIPDYFFYIDVQRRQNQFTMQEIKTVVIFKEEAFGMAILFYILPRAVVTKVFLYQSSSLTRTCLICVYFGIVLFFTFQRSLRKGLSRKERKNKHCLGKPK
jgi:hypothetical protein